MLTETPTNHLSGTQPPQKSDAPKKSLWGWGIAAVYTIFALATLGFVAFTMRQKVELVATDYYAEELAYDKQINRLQQTNDLVTPVLCNLTEDGKIIQIKFPAELKSLRGEIMLYRPSESSLDKKFAAQPDQQGVQLIPTEKLAHGAWRVKINWSAEGREFYNEFPITVQ